MPHYIRYRPGAAASDAVATRELLDRAHEALGRRAWREAFDLLTAADASEELAPEDLERLADAADALGDIDAVIDAYERAHGGYAREENRERAALMALSLASFHAIKGDLAVYRGWRGTAERLLEELPESAGHARLALSRATVGLGQGALDTALHPAQHAALPRAGSVPASDAARVAHVSRAEARLS